jgi:helix-turn-helix protein
MAPSKFKFTYLPAAAEMLGVQRSMITDLVRQGRLKPISGENQQMVFRTADIEALAEELGLANPATAPEALSDNPEGSALPKKTRRPRDAVQKVSLRVTSLKKWLDVSEEEAREWALAQEKIAHPAIRRQLAAIIDKLTYLQSQLGDEA